MTKTDNLKTLLLAGIVVPALVLAPVTTASAQAPEHAGPRGAPGGMRDGPRGERPGDPGLGGERHGPGAERGPGPARGPAERGPGERRMGNGPGPAGGPGERGPGERRIGNGPGPERGPGERGPGERRMGNGPGPERGPGERGPGESRMGNGPGPERGPGERGPGERRMGNGPGPAGDPGERGPGERRMGNGPGPKRGPGERGPGERRMGNGPGPKRGPGERGPGERRMGNGPGPERGPGGPGERRLGNGPGPAIGPGRAAAIGAAAGFAGGFMAATGARRLDEIRRDRREVRNGDSTFIREPGRTIVEEGDRRFVVHDYNDRFRELGYRVNRQRRGETFVDTVVVPGGDTILTFTTADGRLLRRVRRGRDGREVVLFVNDLRPLQDDIVVLPRPPLRIPRDRYIVDYAAVDEGLIYDTLIAPPLAPPPQRYTLDQVLYSPDVRGYVRSIDINTINFDTGSWVVPGDQTQKLVALARAINKAIDRDPNSVFLIEGYTDAVGNPTDNLSLSDRRAQSVAAILTKDFNVPPENLTTQGYGDQNPKENTSGPSAANRRVVVRNITELLAAGGAPPQ